jgi:hypothetical protein
MVIFIDLVRESMNRQKEIRRKYQTEQFPTNLDKLALCKLD